MSDAKITAKEFYARHEKHFAVYFCDTELVARLASVFSSQNYLGGDLSPNCAAALLHHFACGHDAIIRTLDNASFNQLSEISLSIAYQGANNNLLISSLLKTFGKNVIVKSLAFLETVGLIYIKRGVNPKTKHHLPNTVLYNNVRHCALLDALFKNETLPASLITRCPKTGMFESDISHLHQIGYAMEEKKPRLNLNADNPCLNLNAAFGEKDVKKACFEQNLSEKQGSFGEAAFKFKRIKFILLYYFNKLEGSGFSLQKKSSFDGQTVESNLESQSNNILKKGVVNEVNYFEPKPLSNNELSENLKKGVVNEVNQFDPKQLTTNDLAKKQPLKPFNAPVKTLKVIAPEQTELFETPQDDFVPQVEINTQYGVKSFDAAQKGGIVSKLAEKVETQFETESDLRKAFENYLDTNQAALNTIIQCDLLRKKGFDVKQMNEYIAFYALKVFSSANYYKGTDLNQHIAKFRDYGANWLVNAVNKSNAEAKKTQIAEQNNKVSEEVVLARKANRDRIEREQVAKSLEKTPKTKKATNIGALAVRGDGGLLVNKDAGVLAEGLAKALPTDAVLQSKHDVSDLPKDKFNKF